jgi:heavy metal sensor kinase
MRKIKLHKSLLFKLTLWYIVFLGIAIILGGVFLYQGFKDRLVSDLDKVLIEIADETYEEWREEKGVDWKDAVEKFEKHYSAYSPFIMVVEISREGEKEISNLIYPDKYPEGLYLFETRIYYKADHTDIKNLIFETINDDRMGPGPVRTILFPVRGPRILQVGISLEETQRELNQLLVVMILAGGALLIVASLGGSFILNRALHPVKSVVKMAHKISADDLSLRIDGKNRGDEVGSLIETFNDMIIRLEESVNRIRQFSGDVSHELRTPLTIIRGEVEVLLRKNRTQEEYVTTLNSVLEESMRMEKIISDLLFLSRVDAMDKTRLKDIVQLDEVVSDVLETRSLAVKNKKLHISFETEGSPRVMGSRDLLERMAANLVDNAVRYTPEGGSIEVTVSEEGEFTRFQVSDTGIGIPEESLPEIFERFYVVDVSRSRETGGSGLGLSIVKWIADSHGARINVSSRLNQGTTFFIDFPLA